MRNVKILLVSGFVAVFSSVSSVRASDSQGCSPTGSIPISVAVRDFYIGDSSSNRVFDISIRDVSTNSALLGFWKSNDFLKIVVYREVVFEENLPEMSEFWSRMFCDFYVNSERTSCEDVFYWHLIDVSDNWSVGPMIRAEYPSPFRFGLLDSRTFGLALNGDF